MMEFWESIFSEMQTSWGFVPCDSAIFAKDYFQHHGVKNILIPGIGYGRNARIFIEHGFDVTGIEISSTAIELAKKKNSLDITIHHGSVAEMPFDQSKYDGIFCYALIHLLNARERQKFIANCYRQLKPDGHMIMTMVSTKSPMYGDGKLLSTNRYRIRPGLNLYFYDVDAVEKEFGKYGMMECREIDEPIKHMENEPPLKCLMVICKK